MSKNYRKLVKKIKLDEIRLIKKMSSNFLLQLRDN